MCGRERNEKKIGKVLIIVQDPCMIGSSLDYSL